MVAEKVVGGGGASLGDVGVVLCVVKGEAEKFVLWVRQRPSGGWGGR